MTNKTGTPLLTATPGLRFEIVTITPALATEWLGKNFKNNRTVNKSAVQRFASQMKAGRWKVNHQGIAFDRQGQLVDGQTRLQAIKVAGVPVEMVVSFYEGACPLDTFDRGTIRPVGAVLEIGGVVGKGRGASVAAIANMMAVLLSDNQGVSLPSEEVAKVYDAHRDGIGFASRLTSSGRLPSAFAAVAAYTFPICPQRIEALFKQAIANDGPAIYSGAWHLNRLLRTPGASSSREKRAGLVKSALKCVLLHIKDRETKVFKVVVEGVEEAFIWAQKERQKLGLCVGLYEGQ